MADTQTIQSRCFVAHLDQWEKRRGKGGLATVRMPPPPSGRWKTFGFHAWEPSLFDLVDLVIALASPSSFSLYTLILLNLCTFT